MAVPTSRGGVEPVGISGPVTGADVVSATVESSEPGDAGGGRVLRAPISLALASAPEDVGGAAAGGDGDEDVGGGEAVGDGVGCALVGGGCSKLGWSFGGRSRRRRCVLEEVGGDSEGRRALGRRRGLRGGHGAGSHVEEAASFAEAVDDGVDGRSDVEALGGYTAAGTSGVCLTVDEARMRLLRGGEARRAAQCRGCRASVGGAAGL